MSTSAVILIIPCYNEKLRFQHQAYLDYASSDLRFIFVDDGSTDGTADLLKNSFKDQTFCKVIHLDKNLGKAQAVYAGINFLKTSPWWSDVSWVGYWDADLATPLSEVEFFLKYERIFGPAEAIWGSRVYRLGAEIRRSMLRHYAGRVFATVIHHALAVEAYDTQCGAKLFKRDLIDQAFSEKFISHWSFDVEILLRLQGRNILEYPLRVWKDVPGSKVVLFRDSWRTLKDILKLRKKYGHSRFRYFRD